MRWLSLLTLLLLAGCDAFEHSPNQVFDEDSPQNVNDRELEQLMARPNDDDTLRIAFLGDAQRMYDDAEELVEMVNQQEGVDFAILAGDLSDFGLLQEFEWIVEIFDELDAPYISVIGNHDIIHYGDRVYERMFGPKNFTFVYDSVKFVFHDTNGREYGFNGEVPDIPWMQSEMQAGEDYSNIVAVSHVPPFNVDFDPELEDDYRQLMASTPGLLASLHGHQHNGGAGEVYGDGVFYVISFSASQPRYTLIDIYDGEVHRKVIEK